MRRVTVLTPVLILLLAACGGSDTEGSAQASRTATASSAPPSSAVATEPASSAVPHESDRVTPDENEGGGGGNGGNGAGNGGGNGAGNGAGNGGGSGDDSKGDNKGDDGSEEDDRVIEIGGPTLDNTFPTNPFALPRVGGSSCIIFTNSASDVAVTIESVRLVNLQPPGQPGMELGQTPSAHGQCGPHFVESHVTMHPHCDGARLEPQGASGCPVEVRSVGQAGTDYIARLVLRLTATCSDLVGEPCDRLVGRAEPTAEAPVVVAWEVTRRYTSCLAPHHREGEFSEEEGSGRCPPVVESPSPDVTGDTGDTGDGLDTGDTDTGDTVPASPEGDSAPQRQGDVDGGSTDAG